MRPDWIPQDGKQVLKQSNDETTAKLYNVQQQAMEMMVSQVRHHLPMLGDALKNVFDQLMANVRMILDSPYEFGVMFMGFGPLGRMVRYQIELDYQTYGDEQKYKDGLERWEWRFCYPHLLGNSSVQVDQGLMASLGGLDNTRMSEYTGYLDKAEYPEWRGSMTSLMEMDEGFVHVKEGVSSYYSGPRIGYVIPFALSPEQPGWLQGEVCGAVMVCGYEWVVALKHPNEDVPAKVHITHLSERARSVIQDTIRERMLEAGTFIDEISLLKKIQEIQQRSKAILADMRNIKEEPNQETWPKFLNLFNWKAEYPAFTFCLSITDKTDIFVARTYPEDQMAMYWTLATGNRGIENALNQAMRSLMGQEEWLPDASKYVGIYHQYAVDVVLRYLDALEKYIHDCKHPARTLDDLIQAAHQHDSAEGTTHGGV